MNVQNYGLVFLQCISIAFSINVSIGNLIDVDYESGENDRSVAVDQHGGPPLPTICMGELGCFPITPDFVHSKLRPINVTPWPRDKIRTKFLLYTKQSPRDSYQLFAWNDKNLALSSFDKRLPVKVIIPGWLDSRDISKWMRSMKDVLIEYTNTNVIVTEWTNLTPYLIAATNARVVGAEVANLVNFLVQVGGIHAEQVHLIGPQRGRPRGRLCRTTHPPSWTNLGPRSG
ncbi:Pancreatic triacylglycerol lipase [Halotydeus destructor]|nr:Pancreatic triacylglycerol lipase [Halotydeus destructor]